MEEIWKDIDGYEGIYRISNYGRVLSVNFGPKGKHGIKEPTSKVLRQSVSSTGYLTVELYKGRTRKRFTVHSLVAVAFIPNPLEKTEINHIDGNKQNNNVNNLEWVTKSENTRHAIANNLRFVNPSMGKYGKDNPNSKRTAQYTLDGVLVRVWDSREETAKFFGVRRGDICAAINGWKKSCRGFMWRDAGNGIVKDHIQPYDKKVPKPKDAKNTKKKQKKPKVSKTAYTPLKVEQVSKAGVVLKTWNNVRQIGNETDYLPQNIWRCCSGKRKTAYGYVWRYVDE